jgi:transposase-like protein
VRVALEVVLSDEEREVLDEQIRSKLTSVRLALRARIVLLAAQGLQNKEIALALCVGSIQVSRWRERYLESGLEGMERDLPRGVTPSTVDAARLIDTNSRSIN